METEAPQGVPVYTHLMLSGGGYLGYVYIGVYRFLKEYDMLRSIKYLYGTSIGAVFAFLFGLDISYERMEEIFMPGGLLVDPLFHTYDPSGIISLPYNYGIFSTTRVQQSLKLVLQEILEVTDITFQEYLKKTGKDLHINATCINTTREVDFCSDTYPNMSVITAIEASTAIPIIFKPVLIDNYHYVDGATINNLPLHLIPANPGNRGLAFSIAMTNKEEKVKSIYDYLMKLFITVSSASYRLEIDYNTNHDIITLNKIPLKVCSAKPLENNKFQVCYTKEEIERAIYYAYEKTYRFFFKNSIKSATVLSPSNTTDLPPASSST